MQIETSEAKDTGAIEQNPNRVIYRSVEELASELGVSRHSAYVGLRNGTIPHIRLGKRFIISKAAIAKWLAGGGVK